MTELQIDWKSEQDRFMTIAFDRAERAARRAFKRWHSRKREDAIAECVGKVWATWVFNIEKGKDALALLGPNIHFAILWVRYDRKIAGRGRMPDVFDYRAGLERADVNLDRFSRADDPGGLAEALEATGITLDDLRD